LLNGIVIECRFPNSGSKIHRTSSKTIVECGKLIKIPLRYPCIICFNVDHQSKNCLRKVEVQNMFKTKPISSNIVTPKLLKPNNVPSNVVITITTCNQLLKGKNTLRCSTFRIREVHIDVKNYQINIVNTL